MVTTLAPAKRYTIDDLPNFPDDGTPRDLVDGQVVEWAMPDFDHGFFITVLSGTIRSFALERRLGVATSGDQMVRILGSMFDARGADVAFYLRRNIPTTDRRAPATVSVPDFVIEVLSPSDRASEVQKKIHDWLRTGVRLLWYVDPDTGDTTVYQGDRIRYVTADGTLSGEDVLPGFRMRMRDVLDELAAWSTPDEALSDEAIANAAPDC